MNESTVSTPDALWRPLTQHQKLINNAPVLMKQGKGCHLIDEHGKTYLDALAGLWCVNVGYSRKELVEVANQQMQSLPYLSPVLSCEPTIALAEKIRQAVGQSGHVYFSASGSEANETAFKVVRQYHTQSGEPLRHKIIGRYRAYHGNTLASLAAGGQAQRQLHYGPMPTGFLHIHPPNPYRKLANETVEEHGYRCADALEQMIIHEGPETIAAFIMEPIISGGGVLVPPDNYLPLVRRICDKYGVIMICDEVVSGFGRTGIQFGFEHWQTMPDIVTFAKGITSGYMPLAATFVKESIFEAFLGTGTYDHLRHINTFGGHPTATAVGLRNIELIEEENLIGKAKSMGAQLLGSLTDLLADHHRVGDIRGKGLLIGVELVEDKLSKKPLADEKVAEVRTYCHNKGLLIGQSANTVHGFTNVLIICPPLIINGQEIEQLASTLHEAIKRTL